MVREALHLYLRDKYVSGTQGIWVSEWLWHQNCCLVSAVAVTMVTQSKDACPHMGLPTPHLVINTLLLRSLYHTSSMHTDSYTAYTTAAASSDTHHVHNHVAQYTSM